MDTTNIDNMLTRLTVDQVTSLARAALIAEAYGQADLGDMCDRGFADKARDALTNAVPPVWDATITRDADEFMNERDHYEDVARANAYRRMVGEPMVNNNGQLEG